VTRKPLTPLKPNPLDRAQHQLSIFIRKTMRDSLKNKIVEVCDKKINSKGSDVGVSFYAFFANKNDDPELLMEAAIWWIQTHKLGHFEKATKVKKLVQLKN
jgi:Family of unknown function (DUF6500)